MKYREVLRSTKKYQEVRRSTMKYKEVPRSTAPDQKLFIKKYLHATKLFRIYLQEKSNQYNKLEQILF